MRHICTYLQLFYAFNKNIISRFGTADLKTDLTRKPRCRSVHIRSARWYAYRSNTRSRTCGRPASTSGRRAESRSTKSGGGWWATRRDSGTGQSNVSEQSERWRLIDWFVGGRIISRTRTAPTYLMRAWSRSWHRFVYVYHGQYERPRPRAEISNVAMSTVLTKARRVVASNGTVGRSRGGSGAGPGGRKRRESHHDHLVWRVSH